MPVKKIRIIITDDHELYRRGVRNALAKYTDIEVLDEAANGKELLDKLEYLRPDIIITGIQMPVMDGLQVLPYLKKLYPFIKVIMLTMIDDTSIIRRAVENGANAYLNKTAGEEEIYKAITTCYQQWFYFNHLVARAALKYKPGMLKEEIPGLFNKTELVVLKMLQHSEPTRSIMLACDLSERTVLAIIERMKEKTGKATQEELLQFVTEEKLLD